MTINPKILKRKINIAITKLLQSKELREKIGKTIVEAIKDKSMGSAAYSTKKWRERYEKLNKTDPKYSRSKINATFTGELLNDLMTNVKANTPKKQFIVGNSSKLHKKYQGVTKKIGSRSPYKEIAKGLINDLGYDYLEVSDDTREKIIKLIRKEITKILKS